MTWTVGVVVALLLVTSVVAVTLPASTRAGRTPAYVAVGLLAVLALLAAVADRVTTPDDLLGRLLVIELFVVAVAGGGPVTATVLWLVEDGNGRTHSLVRAGDVLRGGAWIGALERCAVYAAVAAGWPEGLAVVLALKGLGRYSELRASGPSHPPSPAGPGAGEVATGGVAERFLIGSFTSILWAVGCAGAYLVLAG